MNISEICSLVSSSLDRCYEAESEILVEFYATERDIPFGGCSASTVLRITSDRRVKVASAVAATKLPQMAAVSRALNFTAELALKGFEIKF